MAIKKTFYVTTPIYYANAGPHIGSAYTTIAADVLARWNKKQGKEVFFLTGTDEHGKKIQEIAKKNNQKPKEFVDKIAHEFKRAFSLLNITNDNFIRTTDKYHEEEVKNVLQELYDGKFIYEGIYESCYCTGCEQYLTKSDLIDGKCPLHPNQEIEIKKEEAYLFKLSKFQKQILNAIKKDEFEILPNVRKNEIIPFIEKGLQDISISRKKSEVPWGIELPFDKNHTAWVWPDAFWNYISGLKTDENKKKFWPADVQLMAKDIFRVHATIWPAILLALNKKLPKSLFIHGYFTVNGQKMSKSLGNVIDPVYLAQTYGADSLRYYMLRAISFGEDGDVSERALIERHNNELANKLGNLVSRVSGLIETNGAEKTSNKLIKKLREKEIEKLMESYQLDKALNEIFAFIDSCNEYVQEKKPWETKDKKVLSELKESILKIAELLSPFMPESSDKITKTFTAKEIKKASPLFRKIDLLTPQGGASQHQRESPQQERKEKVVSDNNKNPKRDIPGIATMADMIKYDDFAKLDLRVGTINKIEDIEGADKLYKLEVDIGNKEKKTILAGIKQHYKKEELKDRQIIVICNLEPRKMKGIESQGMLLAAVSEDHSKVILLTPEKKIDSGSKIS